MKLSNFFGTLSESKVSGAFLVYHGTNHKIENFSTEFVGKQEATDENGPGIYFTTSLEEAERYGNVIYTVKLEDVNLLDDSTKKSLTIDKIKRIIMKAEDWEGTAQNFNEDYKLGLNIAAKEYLNNSTDDSDILQGIQFDFFLSSPERFVKGVVAVGYDGIIIKQDGSKHIIMYNPNKIKVKDVKNNVDETVNSLTESSETNLTNNEKIIFDFILGENITEANGNEMLTRFMKILNSSRKSLLTAALMASLVSSPAFSTALNNAPNSVKQQVTNVMSQTKSTSKDNQNLSINPEAKFSTNFSNVFSSGSYNLNNSELKIKLGDLKKFLDSNKGGNYKILVTASESQVPNQEGLKIGQLAQKRANTLVNTIKKYLGSNIKVEAMTKVGDESWDGSNKDDERYTKDQFVKLEVFANGLTPCEINYKQATGSVATAETNYISYEEDVIQGGAINLSPGAIPDRLQINKNGQILADTGFFADSQHSYSQQWVYVPLYIAELTQLLKTSPGSDVVKGLEKDTKHFNDFNELISVLLKDKTFDYSKDSRNEIKSGLSALKSLWDGGQRDFLFYSFKKGDVKFDIGGDENSAKMLVYSPIGATGFSVKGTQCN